MRRRVRRRQVLLLRTDWRHQNNPCRVFTSTHAMHLSAHCLKYVPYWHVPIATLLMATQPLLTEASLNEDGGYDFIMISVTLTSEFLKLLISTLFYFTLSNSERSHGVIRNKDVFEFAVPAMVYFVNNNLVFYILARITSTQFQILSCLKTVFTAMLFRLFLKKRLSTTKWMAIITLACGAAVSQIHYKIQEIESGSGSSGSGSGENSAFNGSEIPIGVIATVISCMLSSFAGVYNEVLLKRDAQVHSIHLQNIFLYLWGVSFNCLGMGIMFHDKLLSMSYFQGYTITAWVLVFNNAFSGLAISAVLKFANNIVRIFAHAGAMTLTSVFGSAIFGHQVTPELVISMVIVSASTISYSADGPVVSTDPKSTKILLSIERATPHAECELSSVEKSSLPGSNRCLAIQSRP